MKLGGQPGKKSYQNYVQGTPGTFATPAGRVDYLLTKARLGDESTEPERRLTGSLAPVREVLQSEDLDFNQLLQRDLDDHRVATALVPYLLSTNGSGPAFLPPVMAILLPFANKKPSTFPDLSEPTQIEDDELHWSQTDSGDHCRLRRLTLPNGAPHPVALGQVWWNPEHARLVVLDGQHRAMALLAIERTVRKTWQGSGGERYRYFYENRVQELLGENKKLNLNAIESPVLVAWLPGFFGSEKSPHVAARKLFVDVNKEARQPSESRLILLSDGELLNVFARSLLSALRNDTSGAFMPLYTVEYDNPDVRNTQSARWSAFTNIHILKALVSRCVFGPPKYIEDVRQRMGAREGLAERDAYMRERLRVNDVLDAQISDGEGGVFPRAEIGNDNFPLTATDALRAEFMAGWGEAILHLLSVVRPYAAHAAALRELKESWLPDEAVATLAHDALFSGVGMYWTLRDSAEHFKQQSKALTGKKPVKPDIVKAWDLIAEKQADFETLRAADLLGSTSKDSIFRSNQAYAAYNTHACQLGLALTLATMLSRCSMPGQVSVTDGAKSIAAGINSYFASQNAGVFDRRVFLAKNYSGSPLNVISNMDAPRAVEFRYFWLEALNHESAHAALEGRFERAAIALVTAEARSHYLRYLTEQRVAALKAVDPKADDTSIAQTAEAAAKKTLAAAMKNWFGVSELSVDTWFDPVVAVDVTLPGEPEASEELDDAGAPEESVTPIDELLE